MKIVINRCFGGFGISTAAFERLIELGMAVTKYEGKSYKDKNADICKHVGEIYGDYTLVGRYDKEKEIRTDQRVIQVVEELKNKANGSCAELKIIEIPDGVEWEIDEYDGFEHIAEKHRTWE